MIRQFDIVDNPSERSRPVAPYVVVLQSHLYDEGPTLVVAPLMRMTPAAFLTKVSIQISHKGQDYILLMSELAAIDRRTVGPSRGSLAAHEDDIRRALDRLFTGF